MDVDPWLVLLNPPMELALAFQTAAKVQLAASATSLTLWIRIHWAKPAGIQGYSGNFFRHFCSWSLVDSFSSLLYLQDISPCMLNWLGFLFFEHILSPFCRMSVPEYKGSSRALHALVALPAFLRLSVLFQLYTCPCKLSLMQVFYQLLHPCYKASNYN